ncbi:hypothetical protein DEA8626_00595 [Defluviimonas aquaemixtae]|uniref:ABC transporter, phosphonate, periplasmic substrate-binding protein n=1 Tax=Albidovulum aquaemixtae TaxID=1542388 RepID=A0A2R8B347_9RHOB|nr:PhnD/SsuA/transferrin family substrate-binding protein [Defluviimonas aquaemixtae]SPH17081.1 hypothetical protein DEA8626_00595 [Defluviimonas aquaemixtae]
MIASLAMYDWPQNAAENDRLWIRIRQALADEGIAAPEGLTRDGSLWDIWECPALVLAQTCGMPYRTRLHGRVQLVATPDYGLPDAPAGHYYSVLVTRADEPGGFADFVERRLAYNDPLSQSGWAAPQNRALLFGRGFTRTLRTGAHRDSARAVAERRADIAAIDAVTWRLIARHLPDLAAQLRLIDHSEPTPGLPLITSPGQDAATIARAVGAAIAALDSVDRTATGIRGLVAIPSEAYLAVPTPASPTEEVPAD